jgi:hypothetical protein
MVLALLVTGVFNARPVSGEAVRPAGQTQSVARTGMPTVSHRTALTRSRSQVGQTNRLRHASRRSSRFEEVHQTAQAIAWPDLEKGAPSAPRFFFRKISSDDGADADADHPPAPVAGYHSRAPPPLA